MNKTININLGGLIFHIDEDAFMKLTRYLDAIKRSLNNSSGQDEIIKDIEMRIAELFTDKQSSSKQVMGMQDVEDIIATMGQPEDYIIEDEAQPNATYEAPTYTSNKKLYRDKDGGMVGGVAAGLGYYFGLDAVWIRVILVLLVFAGFGTGIIAYLVLWIVTPEAQTTSEKLEMKGEPVNISNIEKKVREEFDSVTNKFKNVDYDKYGHQFKTESAKLGNSVGSAFSGIFKVIAKFIGLILVLSGFAMIIIFLLASVTLGTTHFSGFPFHQFIESGNFTDYPVWFFGLLLFAAIAIPNFFLMLLGFKLISPNMKSIGNIAKYTLIALWIMALAVLISIGLKQATAFSHDGRVVNKQDIVMQPTDTLKIKFVHNDYYSKNINDRDDFKITQDSTETSIIYSNQVRLRIEQTNEKTAYIQIEKEAKGESISDARNRAQQIKYHYKIVGNQIILDNYLVTNIKNKFRDQEIEITIYLPAGTLFQLDENARHYNRSDDEFFDFDYASDRHVYKVFDSKAKCLDCPADNEDYGDDNDTDDEDSNTIIINSDEVSIKSDTLSTSSKDLHELRINKDGIIIKTK
ncbi:hypothetical protein FFWV33_08620 [Flavobacterium faecale]|uniref:Uncharacterized protein n=1 Tax=Flavobacterium faecale TaxID=1355330 RepID=A0A2S1LCV4_9FLAO|nr:PspC domain-containing protein [Flavobacterium faecale]AWG21590.1 hypothetical protein FFWV33_08620 [Flavobacterium faecale]